MTDIVCDASSIISLATNCLLWPLGPLRERMGGGFLIPPSVRVELVDKPLATTRYRFEAIRVAVALERGDLRIVDDRGTAARVARDAARLQGLANSIYSVGAVVRGQRREERYAHIFHLGEAEAVALTRCVGSDVLLVDEKTTRFLIEDPEELQRVIARRTHAPVQVNEASLARFTAYTKGIRIIRSAELAMAAFEAGLFERYCAATLERPGHERDLVSGVLNAVRNSGCAIGSREIDEYVELEFGGGDDAPR